MEDLRYYTLTMKPSLKQYKGNVAKLREEYLRLLDAVGGDTVHFVLEKQNTTAVHIHSMIKCPYIKDKRYIGRFISGYHYNLNLVRREKEGDVEQVWLKYISKEKSDSEIYHKVFGNMFPDDSTESGAGDQGYDQLDVSKP